MRQGCQVPVLENEVVEDGYKIAPNLATLNSVPWNIFPINRVPKNRPPPPPSKKKKKVTRRRRRSAWRWGVPTTPSRSRGTCPYTRSGNTNPCTKKKNPDLKNPCFRRPCTPDASSTGSWWRGPEQTASRWDSTGRRKGGGSELPNVLDQSRKEGGNIAKV